MANMEERAMVDRILEPYDRERAVALHPLVYPSHGVGYFGGNRYCQQHAKVSFPIQLAREAAAPREASFDYFAKLGGMQQMGWAS
mmetsp:Transcript_34717/g.72253  ORF Transcript_34717/g.72253 Transcript_34717/m.72253 type:complete len:85 (+) Transcript_34717:948-1202(+)